MLEYDFRLNSFYHYYFIINTLVVYSRESIRENVTKY